MSELGEVREALASNLDEGTEDFQVSAYLLGSPTPPAIEIMPGKLVFDKASSRGLDEWLLTVRAFVGTTTDKGAQKRLDSLISGQGLKAAAESDRTLGGLVNDLHVTECSGYRIYKREGSAPVLGAEWTVRVLD